MNNKEAIEILKSISVYDIYPKSASEETKQAIDLAIKALEERPQGEWITTRTMIHDGNPYCSICDEENIIRTKFCPNCGADMQKKNEDEKINCLDCKYCYENDTFDFAERICVNAQSEYFGVHVYSNSPDKCNEFLFGNKESNNAQNNG